MSSPGPSAVNDPSDPYRAPALDRGIDVLECLADRGIPMTQAQIARALGRRSAELFRTLATLERRRYVDRDATSGAYRLTLRLFELGHAHSPYDALLRAADRAMHDLAEQLGAGCHLSALVGRRLVVLSQAESPARVRVSVAVGSTVAPAGSASGRLLLAQLEPDDLSVHLADEAEDVPGQLDVASLPERLALIRSRGYEDAHAESMEGISDLSVLIGRSGSRTRAALAVTTLSRDHDAFVASTLPLLRRCAAEITRSVGLAAADKEEP